MFMKWRRKNILGTILCHLETHPWKNIIRVTNTINNAINVIIELGANKHSKRNIMESILWYPHEDTTTHHLMLARRSSSFPLCACTSELRVFLWLLGWCQDRCHYHISEHTIVRQHLDSLNRFQPLALAHLQSVVALAHQFLLRGAEAAHIMINQLAKWDCYHLMHLHCQRHNRKYFWHCLNCIVDCVFRNVEKLQWCLCIQ